MSRGIGTNFDGCATCSPSSESESRNLVSRDRPRDLSDFDCGSFLAVSQIPKAVKIEIVR